jgi:hypothetical protein
MKSHSKLMILPHFGKAGTMLLWGRSGHTGPILVKLHSLNPDKMKGTEKESEACLCAHAPGLHFLPAAFLLI